MDEIRYLISDASKKVDVETHVLRYWEEELGIFVPRNGMGHRYYTEFHIQLFCQVKKLKDKGYQLKAIKRALEQVLEQNKGVINAADILEADISQTLQEHHMSPFLGKIAANTNLFSTEALISNVSQIPKEEASKKEAFLSNGIARLSDYSCLEPFESDSEKLIFHHEENQETQENNKIGQLDGNAWIFVNKKEEPFEYRTDEESSSAECKYFKPNQKTAKDSLLTDDQNHTVKTVTAEHITCGGKIQEEQRIKEKDGQVEMKNKRKDRKTPSAWERRNGMAGSSHLSAGQLRNQLNGSLSGENDWEEENYRLGKIAERMPERTQEKIKGAMYGSSTMEELERTIAGRNLARENEEGLPEEKEVQESVKDGEPEKEENVYSNENSEREILKNEKNPSNETEKNNTLSEQNQESSSAELSTVSEGGQETGVLSLSQDEKMMKFQEIMNHIIGQALEANNEKLSQDISSLVNQKVIDELEDLMRIRDEREEERFRHIDEIIRSCQRDSQGKAEAAAAKMPFFKKKWFGRDNKHLQSF